jgi:predicted nucleic acid-binding Zn ribbon protein
VRFLTVTLKVVEDNMPVYVYKNLKTGETFEFEQRITESALSEHPETGDPVKRLIQPVGIAFKGSGFYVTDSRNSGSSSKKSDTTADAAKAESPSSDSGKSGTAKADSKPETKSESKAKNESKSATASSSTN